MEEEDLELRQADNTRRSYEASYKAIKYTLSLAKSWHAVHWMSL